MGSKRFELSTFRSGGERSIQLSYEPKRANYTTTSTRESTFTNLTVERQTNPEVRGNSAIVSNRV